MLPSASVPSPRAKLIVIAQQSSRQVPFAGAGAACALRSRQSPQQCRAFRFGPWSARADCGAQRDGRRRHKGMRYKCMETLNRNLSWENSPRPGEADAAMKSILTRGLARRATLSGRYVDADAVKSWSDDLSGLRPGRNIEDVEREAIDHLFGANKARAQRGDPWMPLQNLRNFLHSQRPPVDVTPESVLHATTTGSDHDSGIDPITNRKRVQAQESGQSYQDLSGYSSAPLDDPNAPRKLTPEEESKQYKDLDKYKPVSWNEPDGLRKTTREEDSKNYKDLDKYSTVKIDDPDTKQPLSPEEKSKLYDDLDKYKPVSWNEPDGLRKETPEELSKHYDDLDKYGPVRWNEPDGLRKLTPEELSKNYSDLQSYGPVAWNEPDGLRKLTPEEESKKYTDLSDYKEGFMASDAVLQAHEASQQDTTPKAEPLPRKVEVSVEDPTKQYDDLHKYGPVRWNEPDGLRKLTPEELSKNYEDLHKYSQYDNSGPATPRIHPEEASKQYEDLPKYRSFPNAGPETERIHPEVASKQYQDLSKYPVAGYEEPSKTKHVHPEELTKHYADLDKPVMHNEPDGKPAAIPDVVENALEAFDSRDAQSSMTTKSTDGFDMATEDPLGSRTADQIRAEVLRKVRDSSQKDKLSKAKSDLELNWDAESKVAQDTVGRLKKTAKPTLTGNYVRDFPEDFVTSWNTANSPSKSTLYPKNRSGDGQGAPAYATALSGESEETEVSSMDESFPQETSKLEPALNRGATRRRAQFASPRDVASHRDPYSKAPQGLQTSYEEECGGKPTWPTFVKHHEAKAPKESSTGSVSQAETEQPALYKILAYDPATQGITIAETTSGVQETASSESPAAVLLRLSNPSKFLPHFAPLQSQGYEIVSGSGDMLVFRKVRPGSPESTLAQAMGAPVNPIDMMGKPVTGNFASPTGFVNYDGVAGEGSKPSPPLGEEAYAGGRKYRGKKKRSLGRKVLVGTVWVAGIAYAVGVMGEYFSTGGLSGLGPKGL
ncbi:conserved serine-threonine rich protein [Purpureocillium lavendulum]|uniref:Conserved serine-threonine rich protein n=1 Tax=Purpureocillium lavendulum TaxID=1247861 RepID=A0AB34G163_9HYPO|nr:conserved serine-threonine rich protein [Purpureocillium lavendulum]